MKKDSFEKIVIEKGIEPLAKAIVDSQRTYGLDGSRLTEIATEHALRLYPQMKADAAFARLYSESTDLRRAYEVVKSAGWLSDSGSPSGLQIQKNSDPAYAEAMRKRLEALGL
jgi:hypothetical protein